MATFHVDLAFNGGAGAVASIYDYHLYPLQQGLVEVDGTSSRPAWYTKMEAKDTLSFALYDISARPGSLSPKSLVIDFRDPGDPERRALSPFDAGVAIPLRFEDAQLLGPDQGKSAVFGPAPHWQVNAAGTGQPAVYTLIHQGTFLMNAALTVEDAAGRTYLYAFDPEVVVGGGEGPGAGGG